MPPHSYSPASESFPPTRLRVVFIIAVPSDQYPAFPVGHGFGHPEVSAVVGLYGRVDRPRIAYLHIVIIGAVDVPQAVQLEQVGTVARNGSRVDDERRVRRPVRQIAGRVQADVRRRAVGEHGVQGEPPSVLPAVPHDVRIAESLVMVDLFVVDRSVDRFVPVNLSVGIERIFRMFRPVDQVDASRLHHFLIAEWIVAVFAGVEQVEGSAVFDDASRPDTLPVRSQRVGTFNQRVRKFLPTQQVAADDVRPIRAFQVKEMVVSFPVERDDVSRLRVLRTEMQGRFRVRRLLRRTRSGCR